MLENIGFDSGSGFQNIQLKFSVESRFQNSLNGFGSRIGSRGRGSDRRTTSRAVQNVRCRGRLSRGQTSLTEYAGTVQYRDFTKSVGRNHHTRSYVFRRLEKNKCTVAFDNRPESFRRDRFHRRRQLFSPVNFVPSRSGGRALLVSFIANAERCSGRPRARGHREGEDRNDRDSVRDAIGRVDPKRRIFRGNRFPYDDNNAALRKFVRSNDKTTATAIRWNLPRSNR